MRVDNKGLRSFGELGAFRGASVKDNWNAQLNPLAVPLPQPKFGVSEPLVAHNKPKLHITFYTLRR